MSTRHKVVKFRPSTASSQSSNQFVPQFHFKPLQKVSDDFDTDRQDNQVRHETSSPQQLINSLLSDSKQVMKYFEKPLRPVPHGSHYDKEFRQKSVQMTEPFNNGIFNSFKEESKMNLETTYKNDFLNVYSNKKPNESRPPTAAAPRLIPFQGITSYQSTFFNQESNKVNIIPQNHPTVMKELEFLGKTSYKDQFTGESIKHEKRYNFGGRSSFKFKIICQIRNPLTTEMPFFSRSSSQASFKPYKLTKSYSTRTTQSQQKIPAYQGQFDTQYKSDFSKSSTYSLQKLQDDRIQCRDASKRLLKIF